MKRDGNNVASALFTDTLFTPGAASTASGLLQQIDFTPKLVERLKTDPKAVVKDLEELRSHSASFVSLFGSCGADMNMDVRPLNPG